MSRYKINIMEHQYYINTDRDPAWVKMLQERLNGQIDEIREGCPNLSAFDTFALLTMNLMDQLAKSEEPSCAAPMPFIWGCAALMRALAPKTLTKTPCRRPLAGAMPAG